MTSGFSRFSLAIPVDDGLVARLLEAARQADEAQRALSSAREAFEASPVASNLLRVHAASQQALKCESRFAAAWQLTSVSWFKRGS